MQMQSVKTALDHLEQVALRGQNEATLKDASVHLGRFASALSERAAEVRGTLICLEDLEEQVKALQLRVEHEMKKLVAPALPGAANDPYDFGANIAEPLRAALLPFVQPRYVTATAPEAA